MPAHQLLLRTGALLGVIAGLFGPPLAAHAGPLDTLAQIAGHYNVFVLGDMGSATNPYTSDSEGAMAVGGNLWLQDFTTAADSTYGGTALVVGGNLWETRGEIRGDAYVGGSANFTRNAGGATVKGDLNVAGQLISAPTSVTGRIYTGVSAAIIPIDFAQIGADLRAAASLLAHPGGDDGKVGTVSMAGRNLTLTGTSTGVNFFSLTAAQMASLGSGSFTLNAPAGSTAIIDVAGQNVTVGAPGNFGFFFNGISVDHVLFNFYEATTLRMQSFQGSILAPHAAVTFTNGQMNGTLMAAQLNSVLYQNGEFHDVLFDGDLPIYAMVADSLTSSEVPEPVGLSVLAFGLGGVVLLRRRRR